MTDLIRHVFGWVCGQNPAHTWSPGGEGLPLCQRCTGVYVGALVAALLHFARRPMPTPRWLWLNGAFLLFIIPSGFYWIPQNPELRCASGVLFGFGLVSYLWLMLPDKIAIYDLRFTSPHDQTRVNRISNILNGFALIATLVITPALAENGNAVAARLLSLTGLAGGLALAALVATNLFIFLRWLIRRLTHRTA